MKETAQIIDLIAPLQAERDALLASTAETAVGWRPAQVPTEQVQRQAGIAQAAARLVALDAAIGTAQAETDAADEVLAAFDSILED
jgi:hypothetical protein